MRDLAARACAYPHGAAATLEQLDRDPHPLLARLRADEPVSWLPALDGWLVTSHALAVEVMRDPERFTVQDERFTTARIIGASMLSLDGAEHSRHRAPFAPPLRPGAVRARFGELVREECAAILRGLVATGTAELRADFAGPFAARVLALALGLAATEAPSLHAWYQDIVAGVSELTAGRPLPPSAREAASALATRLAAVATGAQHDGLLVEVARAADGSLTAQELASNAAVLLFGGIETVEGMITNALVHLLPHAAALRHVREALDAGDAGPLEDALEESLRLEPAASVVDRYATAPTTLGGARLAAGDLVRVSLAGAGRDPTVFAEPDRFVLERPGGRRHLAFAHGPHVCLGVHLARLEARAALATLLAGLPDLRLADGDAPPVRGLVFRKPEALRVRWTPSHR